MLPFTLWGVKDATTGCFIFDRSCVDISKLTPSGFKIFLEVLVRGSFKKKREVGYVFNQRSLGESKMSIKQDVIYLYHLAKLGVSTGEIVIPTLILAGLVSIIL
jgi:dolichol-phosphate mannosyltransferase